MLNVVRAYHQRPLYFTGFQTLSGPLGPGRGQGSLLFPFGPGLTNSVYHAALEFRAHAPTFQVAVFDSQEFMRGFLAPIPVSLFRYYVEQRWPTDMLLHVFVHEIRVVGTGGEPKRRYLNDPARPHRFAEFQHTVELLRGCELVLRDDVKRTPLGPELAPDRLASVSTLAAVSDAGLALEPVVRDGDIVRYRVYRIERSAVLRLRPRPDSTCAGIVADEGRVVGADDAAPLRGRETIVTLRSPEAMLHYLGQVARQQHLRGEHAIVPRAGGEPLFVLGRESAGTGAAGAATPVTVDYDGESWWIPREAGHSMHVLSLVSQIIGLQKEAKDLPAVTTIRALP
ncbi:MAG TPA: hypothetical protein VM491_03460 [Burkholderiaceae bacterium]|nr:hypothetical protein [Burkholderiaceae bacterium]